MTIRRLARIAEALLEALEHERAGVLGYSFGGLVAQELAMCSPDRVQRLVLVATNMGVGSIPGDLATLSRLLNPALLVSSRLRARALVSLSGELGEQLRLPRVGSVAYAQQVLAAAAWTSLFRSHRIKAPTLVLTGSDDRLANPVNARVLAASIPNAHADVLPNERHVLLLEPSDRVVNDIRQFLENYD